MAAKNKSSELRLTRVYDAPVRAVWDAWTVLEQVEKWWGPRGFTITTHSKDLRAGGTWRYTMHGPDGVNYPNIATYFVMEPCKKLVYDHGATDETPPLFRVTVTFAEANGKTTMEMIYSLPSPEAAAQIEQVIKKANGKSTWDRLAEYVEQTSTGKQRFVINRTFDAPIARVFEMWTNPKHLTRWLPPAGTAMHFLRSEIALAFAFVLMSACGDAAAPNDKPADSLALNAVASGEGHSAAIGAEGGSVVVEHLGATWTLTVPAGALLETTTILVTPALLSGLADKVERFSGGVLLQPSGLTFAQPAVLSVSGVTPTDFAIGLVFTDAGEIEYQLLGGSESEYTLAVSHFSGAGIADIAPGVFGDLLALSGDLPTYEINVIDPISTIEVSPQRTFCVQVRTESDRPLPRVPVEFVVSGGGTLNGTKPRTDATGAACLMWQSTGYPPPAGSEIVISATPYAGAAFAHTVVSRFRWGGSLPELVIETVDSDDEVTTGQTATVCVQASFPNVPAEAGLPLAGYPIYLFSDNGALISIAHDGPTDSNGRFCRSFTVPIDAEVDAAGVAVQIIAQVTFGIDGDNVTQRVVTVKPGTASLTFNANTPTTLAAGGDPTELCVLASRQGLLVPDVVVSFTLAGEGFIDPSSALSNSNGQACTTYTPPQTAPGVTEVVSAAATIGEVSVGANTAISVTANSATELVAGLVFVGDLAFESASSSTRCLAGTLGDCLHSRTGDATKYVAISGVRIVLQDSPEDGAIVTLETVSGSYASNDVITDSTGCADSQFNRDTTVTSSEVLGTEFSFWSSSSLCFDVVFTASKSLLTGCSQTPEVSAITESHFFCGEVVTSDEGLVTGVTFAATDSDEYEDETQVATSSSVDTGVLTLQSTSSAPMP